MGEKIRKRSPRLERTRMLAQFEFEGQRAVRQANVRAASFEYGRPPNVRSDDSFGGCNAVAGYGYSHVFCCLARQIINQYSDFVIGSRKSFGRKPEAQAAAG